MTVQFTSRITGDYKSLRWTFGDGQSSNDSNPSHTFKTANNYDVSLLVLPMDGTQQETEQKLIIKATKPWPVWAKVAAAAAICLLLVSGAIGLICQNRRKALRMPVYFWAEQAPACQTLVLTRADEAVELSPAAPLRIKRDGKSPNLVVQPLEGAKLFAASGQEASMLSIGGGGHIAGSSTQSHRRRMEGRQLFQNRENIIRNVHRVRLS